MLKPKGSLQNETATYPLPSPMAHTEVIDIPKKMNASDNNLIIQNMNMRAIDYKLLATILFKEYDNLERLSGRYLWHEIDVEEIFQLFRKYSQNKNLKELREDIWQSFYRIGRFVVEYHRTEGDERFRGITALLQIEESESNSKFRFRFPDQLVPILLDPKLFAVLKVNLILEMKNKYAIALYQILTPFAEMKYKNSFEATWDEWKIWLKVPVNEKKNSAWNKFDTFRRNVLEVAVNELNSKAKTTGFTVTYELVRRGRCIHKIRFDVRRQENPVNDITELLESKREKSIRNEEAIELVAYFEEVRNGVKVDPQNVDEKEIIKAKTFMLNLDSLEAAKELVRIICSFENKPDFFGGVFKHKARAVALQKKRQERKEIEKDRIGKREEKEAQKKVLMQALKDECEGFKSILGEEEKTEIEAEIKKGLNSVTLEFYERDSESGNLLRKHEFYKWWLANVKGFEGATLKAFCG
ncbi:hypothetical protein H1P_6410008 [Hyella patelloides LEGE 07179]|uniref:Initiator Rep protein WH1 domain-containing protein n=1 Tax=Hyella patelloides LEGE 07179 TaxID=945734 RepID=A0A563W2C3_9CYAN|nr:replication initiation protein [Hyella patelloides]VEP17777.1 hypothetical protein H1P_6410008 [Hyella patelloides LEGE 07179]